MTAFEEMGLMPELGSAVDSMGWCLPTDVQAEAIPMILGGGDVLMAAETGSGKTGAFCLPLLQVVQETLMEKKVGRNKKGDTGASSGGWKLNVYDRDSLIAANQEGTLVQCRDFKAWQGIRCTKGIKAFGGKFYFEAQVSDEGLCRVGWSTDTCSREVGTDAGSWGFGGTGKKSHQRQFDDYGEPFGKNDVIGCLLDLDNGKIMWSKNGRIFEDGYFLTGQTKQFTFFPSVVLKNAEMKFNFGEKNLTHLPRGYTPVCKAPDDVIVDSRHSESGTSTHKNLKPGPFSVIIEPSRELAQQTFDQIQKFKEKLPTGTVKVRQVLLIGGADQREQSNALDSGCEIVVGTPGRIEDMFNKGVLSFDMCRYFVLDEADGLLSAGYLNLINKLHARMPKVTPEGRRLQMIVASATLHNFEVKRLAQRLMHFPTWIDLKGQDAVPDTVHHVICHVNPATDPAWRSANRPNRIATDGVHAENGRLQDRDEKSLGIKLLKGIYTLAAIQKLRMDRALVFCRTKLDCDNMEKFLKSHGLSCVCLHSDRKPDERKANLKAFQEKRVAFLICTDVAARGIDVAGLPFVINVTLPDEKENYLHRIGRVGRADRMGLAVSLVAVDKEKVWYHSNCPDRGKSCRNTDLTTQGGCCIWYDESALIGNIEEHLGITIDVVDSQFNVPVSEFDGKVTYGQKRKSNYGADKESKKRVASLARSVADLAALEKKAQTSFLTLLNGGAISAS